MKTITSKEKFLVPIKWIKGLNMVDLLNDGIIYQKRKIFKIYFSKRDEEPNFNAPILEALDRTREACYIAKMVGICRNSRFLNHFSIIFQEICCIYALCVFW